MLSRSVTLATDDQRLAGALLPYLQEQAGQEPQLVKLDAVRGRLAPDADGLFVLAVASPAEASRVLPLVRETSRPDQPLPVLVVEGPAAGRAVDLSPLDRAIAGRVRWPDEADALGRLVKANLEPGGAGAEDPEDIPGVIRRRVLGSTPSLLPLVQHLTLAATHDVTVLLTGETGTGKTFLARLIHECSARRAERFVAVPCGALVSNLIESELFGHVKGAFTGADRPKVGKFEAAGKGTLLLDEIDTLPLEQQSALLRVVETGEYEPVGGTQTKVCTARLVVASNWDLEQAVRDGRFREDLWYRLNVLSVHLPPLRERPQDIGPLARGMAAHFARKFGKGCADFTPDALAALQEFPWPGNIRQLENVVQQAVLVCRGPRLARADLPQAIQQAVEVRSVSLPVPGPSRAEPAAGNGRVPAEGSLEQALATDEKALIQKALAENGYSRSRTAYALGISRVTLYKKMKKYGLQPLSRLPATE